MIKPRIYFLMEGKKRELDARIYFGLKASLHNFSIVIGAKSKIFDNRNRIQKGIIIFKSLGANNLKQIKEYKRLGFMVGSVDEEGMSFFNDDEYGEKVNTKCFEYVDIFFCWGKNDYQAIIKKFPQQKDKVHIIGNSRVDVLKKPVNKKYFDESEAIKKKYGEFILVNTMFTKANHMQLKKNGMSYIESLINDGYNPNGLRVAFAKPYLKFQEENLKLLKNFISNFSNKYPNKKIIVRPHPGEDFEMWIKFAKKQKNVEVIIDDKSTCSWLIAATKNVSSNCTTVVESYLIGKIISANYKVYGDEKVEYKLPKITGINITKDEELIEFLNDEKEFKLDINLTDSLVKNSIHNIGEDQCSVDNFVKSLNSENFIKEKFLEFNIKDKFSGFMGSLLLNIYYYIRYIYRKLFTKQDKILDAFIKQKFNRLDRPEIKIILEQYRDLLNIKENIKLSQIYPQVFSIEKK